MCLHWLFGQCSALSDAVALCRCPSFLQDPRATHPRQNDLIQTNERAASFMLCSGGSLGLSTDIVCLECSALCSDKESCLLSHCESKASQPLLSHIRSPFDSSPSALLHLLCPHNNWKGGLRSPCVHFS